MATGLVRAALCSFLTEETPIEMSERNKRAREGARNFLSQISDETYLVKFDDFAQLLFMAIDKCVCTCISSCKSNRARCVLMEKLWSSFHQLRLADIWKV